MNRKSGLGRGLGPDPGGVQRGRGQRGRCVAPSRCRSLPSAEPAPAPRALRRGVARRADRLDPRARRAPARARPGGRRRGLRAHRRRAAVAGREAGRSADHPRRRPQRPTPTPSLLEQALVENLHRADLNALEEAAAYQQLIEDFGLTQEAVAKRVGKSRAAIANTLRLFQLPPAIQKLVAEGQLTAGHARALLGHPDRRVPDRARAAHRPRRPVGARDRGAVRGAVERRSGPRAQGRAGFAAEAHPAGAFCDRPRPSSELESLLGDHLDTRVSDLGCAPGRGELASSSPTSPTWSGSTGAWSAADARRHRRPQGSSPCGACPQLWNACG